MNYDQIWSHVKDLPTCALLTTGRSGSDLLQSLFDSHPEIIAFNGSHFFQQFWDKAQSVNYGGPIDAADVLDEYIGSHIHKFRTKYDVVERKGELGEKKDEEINIDRAAFRLHLIGLLKEDKINCRNFMTASVVAFDICLGRDILSKKIVIHHVHRIALVPRYLEDFPDSRLLCMVRDPRANYVSGVENWKKFNPVADHPAYPIYILKRASDEVLELKNNHHQKIKSLRLEDLGDRKVVEKLCDWMGVGYSDELESSTWGNKRWWGDKISQNKIPDSEKGYSPSMNKNSWKLKLGFLDTIVLNHLLFPMLSFFQYKIGVGGNVFWFPVIILIILVPTVYERKYLKFSYLFKIIRRRQIKLLVSLPYNFFRRVRLYYFWLWRRYTGVYNAPLRLRS